MTPRPHLAALLGLALCGGCGEPAPERPHVVLVLVDQLRKDWAEEWMPETLALAERGVIFEDMRSAAPWTYPSVVSMFSGLYPQQHGADGAPTNGKELSTFDARVPMLPLLLKDHYHTAGFVTNPFLQDWNPIHLGFDHYAIDEFIGDQGATRGNPELVWTRDMFADDVNASVLAHYAERGAPSEPEFTYVHYIDVHGPWEGAPFEHGQALERDTAPAVREAATRYVDARIAELHRFFDERYGGNLVFLVTSDHGMEMPGDLTREAPLRAADGQPFPLRQRKATVHDFNTRIPFLVLPGRDVPNAGRIAGACSNVDIHATVLDWAELPATAGIRGISLRDAIEGSPLPERPIYSLQSAFNRHNDCVVVGSKKLFRHGQPGTGAVGLRLVYDLAADPEESAPVGDAFGAEGRLLQEAAGAGALSFEKNFAPPEEDDLRAIEHMGYLGDED